MLGFSRLAALARTSTHCNAVALCSLVCTLPPAEHSPGAPSVPRGPDMSHPPRLARIIALSLRAAAEDAEVQVSPVRPLSIEMLLRARKVCFRMCHSPATRLHHCALAACSC